MLRRENAWAQLDVADQARDTQALHREKGGLRAPALPRRHSALLRLARHDVLNVALPHGASRRAASGPEGPAASPIFRKRRTTGMKKGMKESYIKT